MKFASTAIKLKEKLESISHELLELINDTPINISNRRIGSFIVANAPDYDWGKPSAETQNRQLKLKRKYNQWFELLQLLFSGAPQDTTKKLQEADELFRMWLELGTNYSLTPNKNKNEIRCKDDIANLEKLLDILMADSYQEIIIIPDTNALLTLPSPQDYCSAIGVDTFTFMFPPTVLAELDDLKISHRNPDVREKAKRVIKRIKGWRIQGSLITGITIDKTITVKTIAQEPDMKNTLSWLDSEVPDDRIIASTLRIMTDYPTAKIIIATSDINLQNKAEIALIDFLEPPKM